jgi:hypothetical protein
MKFLVFLVFLFVVFSIASLYLWLGIRKKTLSRGKILIVISSLLLFYGLIGLIFQNRIEKLIFLASEHSPFRITDTRHCSCNFVDELHKDAYVKHLSIARKISNNLLIKNNSIRKKLIQQKHLVDVVNNDGYRVASLTHSSSHLTQLAYDRLKEIGVRFKNALKSRSLPNEYFVVSSLSRTEHTQQEDLRKIEINAFKGISSHSYGLSFDIKEIRTPGDCPDAQLQLKQVLREMQKEKKILICPESKCVHVTVIN